MYTYTIHTNKDHIRLIICHTMWYFNPPACIIQCTYVILRYKILQNRLSYMN